MKKQFSDIVCLFHIIHIVRYGLTPCNEQKCVHNKKKKMYERIIKKFIKKKTHFLFPNELNIKDNENFIK